MAEENTLSLLWKQDRLTVLIFGFGALCLGLFVFGQADLPRSQSQFIIPLDGVIMLVGVGGYYQKELLDHVSVPHATMHCTGTLVPYDVFYVKSNDPYESVPLEEGRFETEIPAVEALDFSKLYGEKNAECYTFYLRHWGTFVQRVGRMQGIALAGGIPIVHSNSEVWIVKPLPLPPRQGKEGFKVYPTFELLWTMAGDASRDIEPFNIGWRESLKAERELAALEAIKEYGLKVPDGQSAAQFLKAIAPRAAADAGGDGEA